MNDHVLVIGAGVIGAASSLALAESGFRVSLIDKAAALGEGASGDNGAQLSYSYTDSLAAPNILWSMPKLMAGLDSSFRFYPRFDPDFVKWVTQFILNCSWRKSDLNTLAVLQTSLKSKSVLNQWSNKYNFDFNHKVSGKLHLYESQTTLDSARRRVELKNQYGAAQQVIDRSSALEIEPALDKMNANLVGALYSPDEEVGDVRMFTAAAIEKALELGGGELFLDTEFISLKAEKNSAYSVITSQGEIKTGHLVICAGIQSAKLAKSLGLSLPPICSVAGYSLTFPKTGYTPQVSLTDTSKKIVLCQLGDNLRVAGMADVGRVVSIPPKVRISKLEEILRKRFPEAGDYTKTNMAWAGMRPMTANSRPIITKTKLKNVYVNSGHGMLGWTLAAGAADSLTKLVLNA